MTRGERLGVIDGIAAYVFLPITVMILPYPTPHPRKNLH